MVILVENTFLASVLVLSTLSLAQQGAATASEKSKQSRTAVTSSEASGLVADGPDLDEKLLHLKRVFVDSFGDDLISKQIQAMVVSSLTQSKQFIVTENKEKADGILKGSSLEKTSQELHSSSDATAAGGSAGGYNSAVGSSHGALVSRAMGISDSNTSTETINDARIAVRLVDSDGDVIWASTQESKGGKYKGAAADVADKVVKQLLRDREKIQKTPSAPSATE
jgi:curli biogenesis system outer membrane secretion channel CsgG